MKEKKHNHNKKISKLEYETPYLPTEIIWLIFTYSDMATLARCSRTCSHWYLLSQSFWIKELNTFLETLKNERERLKEIDVSSVVICTKEAGSTMLILNQLHSLEAKIEKYKNKLNVLEEKKEERKKEDLTVIAAGDMFCGYYVMYPDGHQPSFFGDIKRMFNKSRYEKNIEQAEKKEEQIIRQLGI